MLGLQEWIEKQIEIKNKRKAMATIMESKPEIIIFGACEVTFIHYKRAYTKKHISDLKKKGYKITKKGLGSK